ncbi:MAG: thermonuclease family protein [Gemmatimonadota bacterium]
MRRSAFLVALLAGCAPPLSSQSREPCVVSHIVDGDTFDCAGGPRVRPIGIDTPERSQGEIYALAREALRAHASVGDTVMLEYDAARRDRYGRILAWVWRDSMLVNEAMIAEGWAVLYTVPPNVRYVARLEAAQRSARERRAGLWARDGFACLPAGARRGAC